MGFSRQEYWNGFPFPSTGDLPDPGMEPRSPALQADALPPEPPGKAQGIHNLQGRVYLQEELCFSQEDTWGVFVQMGLTQKTYKIIIR